MSTNYEEYAWIVVIGTLFVSRWSVCLLDKLIGRVAVCCDVVAGTPKQERYRSS